MGGPGVQIVPPGLEGLPVLVPFRKPQVPVSGVSKWVSELHTIHGDNEHLIRIGRFTVSSYENSIYSGGNLE